MEAIMRKTCRWCGRIVEKDHDCPNRPKPKYELPEEVQGRYTKAWEHKSEDIKERSQYMCATCREIGRYTYEDLETHHIIPLRLRPDLLLEDSNLICLCKRCHVRAERGEIDAGYLSQLAKERDDPPHSEACVE